MQTLDCTIQWKDSDEIEVQTFGIGQYVEGQNDEEDEEIFFYVDSIDELFPGADFGDFKIIEDEE